MKAIDVVSRKIRQLYSDDLSDIMCVQRLSPPGAIDWSQKEVTTALANPWSANVGYLCLGLLVDNDLASELCGFIIFHIVHEEADLQHFAVVSALNGKGCGMALLYEAKSQLECRNVSFVFLEVRLSNVRAITLYKRFGFNEVGVRRDYYVDSGEDAIVMKFTLQSQLAVF